MNNKVRSLTIDAMMLAIIALMTFVPNLGYITLFGVASNTLIHIPVLIGAYLFGWKKGGIYGFFFGILSLCKALQSPSGLLDAYFINPLISVLPRVAFGLLAGFFFEIVKKIDAQNLKAFKITLLYVGTFVLTIIHSILTLGTLYLLEFQALNEMAVSNNYASFWIVILGILATNGLIEAGIATVIVPNAGLVIEKATLKNA